MTRLRMLLAVVPLTAVLAGCSSGSDGGGDSGGGDAASTIESGSNRGPGAAEAPAEGEAAQDRATASNGAATTRPTSAKTPLQQRAVISTGTVSLLADDVAATRRDVQRIVDGQRGQITEEDTDTDKDGVVAYARLVLRVPSSAFDETIEALEQTGTLRSSTRASEDVTTEVIDTEVRVRAQRKSLARVEQLLARADTLKDIIWIESQLTQRQAELDSLESQQAWLADQTSMSTVTVDIERTPDQEKKKDRDEPAGFLTGLENGWTALTATGSALATVFGALLPFAVVAAILGGPAWLVVRRGAARRRRTTSAA